MSDHRISVEITLDQWGNAFVGTWIVYCDETIVKSDVHRLRMKEPAAVHFDQLVNVALNHLETHLCSQGPYPAIVRD